MLSGASGRHGCGLGARSTCALVQRVAKAHAAGAATSQRYLAHGAARALHLRHVLHLDLHLGLDLGAIAAAAAPQQLHLALLVHEVLARRAAQPGFGQLD